jgi:Uma2 family endonuclease
MPSTRVIESAIGDLTWEIAELFPRQGHWSEGEYLSLHTNRLVELSNGKLEVLPSPTQSHQLILLSLFRNIHKFVMAHQLGVALFAPLPVKLWDGTIREPDIIFMRASNKERRADDFWTGADLVIEVVSSDDPKRDLEVKRHEYAQAGIPEYWIVDLRNATMTVFELESAGQPYVEVGVYKRGEFAASVLLEGLTIDVAAVFEAANE